MKQRACGIFSESYKKDMAIIQSKKQWTALIGFIIFVFIIPLLLRQNRHALFTFNQILILIISIHGLNLLTGYCGQISIGHSAFMAVGAYTYAILIKYGFCFWFALPFAGISSLIIGIVFGSSSLKIKGFYLAMATLAAQFIIIYTIKHLPSLTGGTEGMEVAPVTLFGFVFDTPFRYCYLTLSICIIMTYFAKSIARSATGKIFVSIRDNDLAAEVMGVNLFVGKLKAFAIASFYAGISGALLGGIYSYITADNFTLTGSILFLGMLIIGGMGSIMGSIFGVTLMLILGDITTIWLSPFLAEVYPALGAQMASALGPIIYSLVIILFLIFEPRGVNHGWNIFKAYYRLWPYSY